MSEIKFVKTLNRPEAKYRYWHIKKEDRDFFPEAHEIFKLKFEDKEYEMKVNHKDDIMTGQLYNVYKFPEGTTISVEKKRTKYVLTAEGTQSW
jgi:hypothetical protein